MIQDTTGTLAVFGNVDDGTFEITHFRPVIGWDEHDGIVPDEDTLNSSRFTKGFLCYVTPAILSIIPLPHYVEQVTGLKPSPISDIEVVSPDIIVPDGTPTQ